MIRRFQLLIGLCLVFVLMGSRSADADASSAPATGTGAPTSSMAATVTADSSTSAIEREISDALDALTPAVRRMSGPDALERAFRAYYRFKAAHPERVTKPYLYYVDYGLDNATARGYVFDMDARTVIDGPFTVAHGRGSSRARNGIPTSFSNRPGSNATSLGLYVTQETYAFGGRSGGTRYSSVGLRLAGVSRGFNDAARARGVVAHGAPYVSAREAGRSEGCPAMEQARARRLLPMIADGALVFLYSPADPIWLEGDSWAKS